MGSHLITILTVKAVPLQAWSGPERSRKLRLTDFMTTAQDGGKVVSLTHRPPLSPGNAPGTRFFVNNFDCTLTKLLYVGLKMAV